MRDEFVASAAKATPVVGGNLWLWLSRHDINWWVAVATLAYISANFVFAWRKDQRDQRAREHESTQA